MPSASDEMDATVNTPINKFMTPGSRLTSGFTVLRKREGEALPSRDAGSPLGRRPPDDDFWG
jgi:hypothetical protein